VLIYRADRVRVRRVTARAFRDAAFEVAATDVLLEDVAACCGSGDVHDARGGRDDPPGLRRSDTIATSYPVQHRRQFRRRAENAIVTIDPARIAPVRQEGRQ
jgi:hypothetical protein